MSRRPPQPFVAPRPGPVERQLIAFTAEIDRLSLGAAVARYRERLGGLLATALRQHLRRADLPLACGPGCGTCCHQPLVLAVPELAALYFADESRLGAPPFARSIAEELTALGRWLASGAKTPRQVADQQWAERRPCVLLGNDDRCTAYEARPFVCRNAHAVIRCTFAGLESFAFEALADLDSRLLEAMHRRYRLAELAPQPAFHIVEGLAWLCGDRQAVEALRALW